MVKSPSLTPFLRSTVERTDFGFLGNKYEGKVRDVYQPTPGQSILIATDRQSAFDIPWCTIPLKGQVLNQLSAWWFTRIADVMPTHVLAVPDPNVMVVKKLTMVPVEIVVRAYLTGSTGTSAWVNYEKGVRNFCGNVLPEGMRKNQKFADLIITPTTKGEHDELIERAGIIERGLSTAKQWEEISDRALALFRRGQQIALERGLILVDTKYEMGYDEDGTLTIADEVHTPDSSRYWVASSYEQRFAEKKEPESLDKEFFRLWLREQGFDPSLRSGQALSSGSGQVYGKPKPEITDDVRVMLAARYIDLYERMTGETFTPPTDTDVPARIERNLRAYIAEPVAA
ncbi:MAG: phosphoribosylaminoimidazolesuccinocarboxamide synthase [Candidatus Peregrinibacteria bacterium]|nr:phosphoribosylaminoimidazolesuccinocarboxamide synthase [Candidatus Peregrinibacteria bacterium]